LSDCPWPALIRFEGSVGEGKPDAKSKRDGERRRTFAKTKPAKSESQADANSWNVMQAYQRLRGDGWCAWISVRVWARTVYKRR
jgi:hypothetical protein